MMMNSSTCSYSSNPSAGSSSWPASYLFSTPSFLPSSSLSPFPSLVDTYASLGASGSSLAEWDEALSTNRSPYPSPNVNARAGYQDDVLALQPPLMPMWRPSPGSMDTMVGYTNQQSHWRPIRQEGMGAVYPPRAPISGIYPPPGITLSLPIDPPMNCWVYPGGTAYEQQATDPLIVIPVSNGGTDGHSAEWANRRATPTLASARDTKVKEVTASYPQHGVAGRGLPRHVRPRAEERIWRQRKPKQKRQAVSASDPQAEAIVGALCQEMECCEAQGLECGPCFMRRVGELGIKKGIPECARHECLLMLMAIDPGNRRSRSIADPLKKRVKDLVVSHLRRVPTGSVQSTLRAKDPQGWACTRLASDPDFFFFTRKEG